ncbi:MAG: hypothetical protein K9I86_04495, partial [Cryomorphaceae bacterium]|nr:hypothetical protein [Cryomorphaceae bacterium]
MNHLTQSLRRLAAAALVLLSLPVFSQLSGTYTIDPSGTGTTNYASFTAAVSALTTSGVSGPVTFNVAAGTYSEQIVIGAITGSSATNRVTFQKAPTATGAAVLTFAATSTANYTVQLTAASNLTFKDLTLANTAVSGQTVGGIVEYGGSTSNIQFINNTFNGNAGTSTSSSYGALRYGSTPSTGYATGVWKFVNNTFNGTSYSINVYGSTTVNADSLIATNNTINGTYYHIYAFYAKNVVINNNTISTAPGLNGYVYVYYPATSVVMNNNTMSGMAYGLYSAVTTTNTGSLTYSVNNNVIDMNPAGASQYGIYIAGSTTAANKIAKVTITNNKLALIGTSFQYGIYTSYVNSTTADPSVISNNMISCITSSPTAGVYALYPFHVANMNADHNTIHVMGGSATTARGLYINRSTSTTAFAVSGLNIRNNIVSNTGLGYAVEIASTANTAAMIGAMSNNAYQGNAVNPFRAGTTPANYTTLADWQTATTKDAGSAFGTIAFYSNADLHIQNALANNIGTPLASITTDIDGQSRSATTPDAGADEYTPLSCISATAITVPTIGGNTATVSWTTANTPVSYKVRHRTNGTGAWTVGTQTAATKNLTGLQSYTAYEVQVKEFCSATDSSIWSPSTVFTTAIIPNWIENFQVVVPTVGWSRAAGRLLNPTVFTGTSTVWGQDDYGNQVPNGANGKSARTNIYSTNHFHWLMSPSIVIPNNANSYQIEYDLALTTWNATTAATMGVDDTLALVVSLDNGLTWNKSNAVVTYSAASAITPAGSHVIIPVPAAWKGNTIKLGWYSQSTVSNADNDVFVDNFEVKAAATCPITATPTIASVTTCGPQAVTLSATWSNPAYQHIWLSPTGVIRGRGITLTTPVLTASTTQDSRLIAADNSLSAVSGGPQITLANPAGGGGNFTNGMWFTATQPFMLDSVTVRANATATGGVVRFLVRISEKAGSKAGNTGAQLYLSDTITVSTTSTTGELFRVPVNIPVLPGSYYVNLNFVAGTTGALFRSTALPTGSTFPYALGGLGSLDSVQFGATGVNARIYYLFNWKLSAACLGPIVTTNVTYASVPSVTLPHVSGFANGAPCNWVATAAPGATWQAKAGYTGNGYTATTLNGTPFMMVDDDGAGSSAVTPNSTLTTPSFPALGYDTLTMKFLSVFKGGTWGGKGYLEVWSPTNGVFGWQTIDSLSADEGIGAVATGWAAASKTYNVTAHQSNQFKARFRYDDKGLWAGWWAIDEFELNGVLSPTGNVRVSVTTDLYGSEVSWLIRNTANKQVYASGGPYTDQTTYNAAAATYIDTVAIPLTGNYEFRLTDSYGDGLYDGTNTGTYIVEKLCAWGNSIIDTGAGANDYDPGAAAANVASYDSAVFNMSCIQYKNVTFNVDMNQVTQSFTTPEVNGFWNNWCGNCNPLTDANGDGIWTTTLPLPVGSTQEYKFSADAWTIQEQNNPTAPCTNGNATYTNRVLVVPATDTVLNVVCWSQCTACDVDVTLKVNMAWEVANNAISANGVHVAGDFQGWNPATTPMTDANNDGIYEVTINVPANSSIQYKFINGNAWGADEPVPSACAVTGTTNRGATFAYGDSTLNPVCYGKCTDCAAGLGESLQNVSLFPNPTRGQFNLARMDAATEVEVSVLDLQGKVLTVA